VGSHVAVLLRSRGHGVRALHRPESRTEHLLDIGCELVPGNLLDGVESLARSIEGCEALVHAAAIVYGELPWPRVRAVNVQGTVGVFRGAALAGIRRAVHLSSVAVYGPAEGPVDEGTSVEIPLNPGDRYARSKREAERVVKELAVENALAVAVLRPSAVYGERDRLFTPRLARALGPPLHFLAGTGQTPLPAVYAGNLAEAVLAALRGRIPHGTRAFNVGDDHPVSQRLILDALAEALGVRFRPVPTPAPMVLAVARLAEAVGIRIPGAEELPIARAARLAVRPNPYISRRVRDELGWVPPHSLDEGLRRTAAWFAAEGEWKR
jgi:nucleoside-diphosphate-sugar epimerase